MRKSKKQMVMAAAACAMMGVMAIGGTMAYLTDSETATNTFTIGQVKIDLEEPEYAKLTETQKKDLVPNQIVAKDPQVENTGVNDAIVFSKVEIIAHQLLQQLISIQLTDEGAGVIEVGDIGGILGEDIAYDLVDGVVPFLLQRVIDLGEDLTGLPFLHIREIETTC